MDVIKAVENFQYYHSMTGQSREEWEAWRVQACEEWMLDKEILRKEGEGNGSSKSESDYSSDDKIVSVTKGDRGQGWSEPEYRLPDAARLSGEDGAVRKGVSGSWYSTRGCY